MIKLAVLMVALLLMMASSSAAFTILEFEPRNTEDCILKYQKKTQCDQAATIVNIACRCKFDPFCTSYSEKAIDCILKNIGDAKTNQAATATASACNRKY